MENLSSSRSWQTPTEVKENLKDYFTFLCNAHSKNERFPVDLDLVWPLAYSRKDHAVRELKQNFIEGFDYQPLPKNGEQDCNSLRKNAEQDPGKWGGSNKVTYHLTIQCMEYFIVRKVREVFEVYRTVFEKFLNEMTGEKQDKPKVATFQLPKIPTESTFVCDPQRALFITSSSAYTDFNRYFDMMWSREMCGCRFPIDLAEVYTLRYKKYDAATNHINKKKCCSFLRYREGIDYIKIKPEGDRCTHYMMTPEMFYDIFCDYNDNLAASYINHYGQRRVPMRSGRAYELPRKNTIQRAILAGKMDALDAEQILCIRRFHEDCPNVDDPKLKDLPVYREMVNDIVRWLNSKGKILDPEMYTEILEAEEEAKAWREGKAERTGADGDTEAAEVTGTTEVTEADKTTKTTKDAGATSCKPATVLGDSIAEPSLPATLAAPVAPASTVATADTADAVHVNIKVDEAEKVLCLIEALTSCSKHMVLDIDMRSKE